MFTASYDRSMQANIHQDPFVLPSPATSRRISDKDDANATAALLVQIAQNPSHRSVTGLQRTSRFRRCLKSTSTLWQEILVVILVLAATFASFATLYPYQGRPLPDWPFGITISALLSIYSVVLRLAASFLITQGLAQMKWRWFHKKFQPLQDLVTHDNATRGPLGAFELLWRLPMPVTWQWMGCVLMILALLVGPFTQQVVQYEQCSLPVDISNATIARTAVYWMQGPVLRSDYVPPLDSTAQASVNSGVYSPGVVENTCSSGNCTYELFASIGYCTLCEDISSQVDIDQVPMYEDEFERGVRFASARSSIRGGLSVNFKQSMSTMSAESMQGTIYGRRANYTTCGLTLQGLQILIGLPLEPRKPITGTDLAGCDSPLAKTTWRCQGYGAANCVMSPCVRTYDVKAIDGILHEHIISEEILPTTGTGHWPDYRGRNISASLNQSCLSNEQWTTLRSLNYTANATSTLLPYSMGNEPLDRSLLDRGCLFAVDGDVNEQLWAWMGSTCGTLTGTPVGALSGNFRGPQILESIFNYGDFSLERTQSLFNNISKSLTNYMRANPGKEPYFNTTRMATAPALGTAYTTKTCVHVRWAWLIWPSLVSLFTLVFFVGVISSSRALPRDVRTWKSSLLPFLFYGHSGMDDAEPDWAKTRSQHVKDMEATAKEVQFGLECDEAGLATLRHRGGVF